MGTITTQAIGSQIVVEGCPSIDLQEAKVGIDLAMGLIQPQPISETRWIRGDVKSAAPMVNLRLAVSPGFKLGRSGLQQHNLRPLLLRLLTVAGKPAVGSSHGADAKGPR